DRSPRRWRRACSTCWCRPPGRRRDSSAMRDLTSRLREIVKRDHGAGAAQAPVRELTYVPDTDGLAVSVGRVADTLGGVPLEGHDACLVIDPGWERFQSHGR